MLSRIKDIYAHMIWADKQVWKAVEELDEEIIEEKLHGKLTHHHLVQRAFLLAWQNEFQLEMWNTKFKTLEELKNFAEEYFSSLPSYLDTLTNDDLEKEIFIPWQPLFEELFKIKAQPIIMFDTLYQAVSHSSYHRGQINKVIREVGGNPPTVDYISWAWSGKLQDN